MSTKSGSVRVDADWQYRGLRVLQMENDCLQVNILPEIGGRIWRLVHKPSGHELLWHNPRLPIVPAPFGASYDDHFYGGWDELFPNDAPAVLEGERFPDHGELWNAAWDWSIDNTDERPAIVLRRATPISTAVFEKRVSIDPGSSVVRLNYRMTNIGPQPIRFLWKLHVALELSEGSRLDLPGSKVLLEPDVPPRVSEPFRWPTGRTTRGDLVDMRKLPDPSSGILDFYYATELSAGWCAFTHGASQVGLGLSFSPQVFTSVWWFASYNGWRGHRVFILEPCTGYPYKLEEAVARGTCTTVEPGAEVQTTVTAAVFSGLRGVSSVESDGSVRTAPA